MNNLTTTTTQNTLLIIEKLHLINHFWFTNIVLIIHVSTLSSNQSKSYCFKSTLSKLMEIHHKELSHSETSLFKMQNSLTRDMLINLLSPCLIHHSLTLEYFLPRDWQKRVASPHETNIQLNLTNWLLIEWRCGHGQIRRLKFFKKCQGIYVDIIIANHYFKASLWFSYLFSV